ncbi:hypothetical protein HMPREF1981_01529, partial [Bacteroides pyogenes F0041]
MYGNSPLPGKEKGWRVFMEKVEGFREKGRGLLQRRWKISRERQWAFTEEVEGSRRKDCGFAEKRRRALKKTRRPLKKRRRALK